MKKVLHKENVQFVYETKEERTSHVKLMENHGWKVVSGVSQLTVGTSILDNNQDNREWFAEYQRYI